MSSRSSSTRCAVLAGGLALTPAGYRRPAPVTAWLRADGELRGGGVIVHAVTDLARQDHRSFGLARTVAREAARGRDERLRAQSDRVAAPPGQLAPRVEQRLPQWLGLLADGPVRRNGA